MPVDSIDDGRIYSFCRREHRAGLRRRRVEGGYAVTRDTTWNGDRDLDRRRRSDRRGHGLLVEQSDEDRESERGKPDLPDKRRVHFQRGADRERRALDALREHTWRRIPDS